MDDLISRQAVIECLWRHMDNARKYDEWTVVMELERVRNDIDNMPTAEPPRPFEGLTEAEEWRLMS